jgi:hypothetical protein
VSTGLVQDKIQEGAICGDFFSLLRASTFENCPWRSDRYLGLLVHNSPENQGHFKSLPKMLTPGNAFIYVQNLARALENGLIEITN